MLSRLCRWLLVGFAVIGILTVGVGYDFGQAKPMYKYAKHSTYLSLDPPTSFDCVAGGCRDIGDIGYIKDERYGLCYAQVFSRTAQGPLVMSLATVPCDKVGL